MSTKPQRLLIIDDDHGIRHSLARIFRGIGLEVELAADGESAIDLARRFEPDCVLADVRLPGMDGPTTCRLIRAHLPKVETIFMTAYAASEQVRMAAHVSSASDSPTLSSEPPAVRCRPRSSWLSKPLDVEQLISQIKTLHTDGQCR